MERRFASPQYLYSHFRKQLSNQEVEVVLTRKISGKECLLGRVEPHVDQVKVKKNQSSEGKVITLIHELLHLKYPRGQDGEIEEHALRVYENLTPGQVGFFEFILSEETN